MGPIGPMNLSLFPTEGPIKHLLFARMTLTSGGFAVLKFRSLSVAVIALIATLPLAAQDKVNLAWKLEKDKAFYQEMLTIANQSMKVMGQDVTQKQSQTFYFSYTPTAVDSNGNW